MRSDIGTSMPLLNGCDALSTASLLGSEGCVRHPVPQPAIWVPTGRQRGRCMSTSLPDIIDGHLGSYFPVNSSNRTEGPTR